MRTTLVACLALLAGCGGGEESSDPGSTAGASDAPPSVILISLDTLRADHVGLYGCERDTTPYLDRLANECLVFDRAYTTAPWTLIAHMSMLTGLGPEDHGVTSDDIGLSLEVPTVPERLRQAGYRTVGLRESVCVWLSPRYGFKRGFDVYRGHEDVVEARLHVEEELAGLNANRPLFLFMHLFDIHTALFDPGFRGFYDPPPPFLEMFREGAYETLADVNCYEAWEGREEMTADEIDAMIAIYDGGIRYVDKQLEEMIEGWRESGLLDRSLLIITADHGESLGDRGRISGHGGVHQEGLRIPLLVRFPDGYRAGEREGGVVSVVDYAPTILEQAGLAAEPWLPGRSLRAPRPDERVVTARRVLVTEDWKVMQAAGGKEVYNLREDAAEEFPLGPEDEGAREAARRLRRLDETDRAARPPVPGEPLNLGELSADEAAELRDLGYAGEVGG